MMWPVGVLAVLSIFGGWLQVPWRLAARRRLARPGRASRSRRRPGRRSPSRCSPPRRSRSRGIGSPGAGTGRPSERPERAPARAARGPRGRSSTSSTSTRPTTSSSTSPPRGARASSTALRRGAGLPRARSVGSRTGVREARAGSPPSRRASSARTRSRSPPGSPSSSSSSSSCVAVTDDRPHLRSRSPARSASGSCPGATARAAGGFALLVALGRARRSGSDRRSTSTSQRRPPGRDATSSGSRDLGVSYKVGLYDFSLWLVGLTVDRHGRRRRLRALGRARAPRRVLRAPALPRGRDGRRLHRPGPAPLLRLLSRRC